MFGIICDMALGSLTKIDIGLLISFAGFILMLTWRMNVRFSKKANRTELEKLERDNHDQHLKLEKDMKDQLSIQVESLKDLNEEIFAQVVHISERLDYHIQNPNDKKK
jgi:hypothetical protein